jgi:hypothetical protein
MIGDETDDLGAFERRLTGRPMPEPSLAVRSRVLRAVNVELPPASSASARHSRPSLFAFAAGLAAAMLIAVNLSLIAASVTRFGLEPSPPLRSLSADVLALRQVCPELSMSDATRAALVLEGGRNLRSIPQCRVSTMVLDFDLQGWKPERVTQ